MATESEKEIQQLKKRIEELAEKSYQQNIYTYTGFLSMAEQDVFLQTLSDIKGTSCELFGGSKTCERQMLRFGSEETLGYEEPFPILCLCIQPCSEKFAEHCTHRDFLGAIMNLGMERSVIGDIFVEGKSAYIFCMDKMAPYIMDHLDKVRHTNVTCHIVDAQKELVSKEPECIQLSVSGERADSIVAKIYHLSRNQSLVLFKERRIYINGRLNENNSYILKEKDAVTVRGYGKFIYYGTDHITKKGKLSVSAGIYR